MNTQEVSGSIDSHVGDETAMPSSTVIGLPFSWAMAKGVFGSGLAWTVQPASHGIGMPRDSTVMEQGGILALDRRRHDELLGRGTSAAGNCCNAASSRVITWSPPGWSPGDAVLEVNGVAWLRGDSAAWLDLK